MRVGMIGDRGHTRYVLAGLEESPEARVVGLSPGSPQEDIGRLQAWCDEHHHSPAVFADYRDMLDRLRPEVVSICGPFELHAGMCIEAFRRGIHVFSEKPVCTTFEDLRALKTAHADAGVHFAAMMGSRYDPAFYTAWKAVQGGAVGAVRLLNARKSYKLGEREPYYRRRETYGGSIPWAGSHAIDWIYWFSGQAFRSVYATHSTRYNRRHGDMEVSALCHFTLTGEVFASVSIDYFRPAGASTHGDDRLQVVGTGGTIDIRQGKVFLLGGETGDEEMLATQCDRQIFRDFLEQVAGKSTSLLGPEATLAVAEACLSARRSADEGRVIAFDRNEGNGDA